MLGFKELLCETKRIAGIETMHMVGKEQLHCLVLASRQNHARCLPVL